MAYIDAGQWQQAFEAFQLLQGIYPNNPEVKDVLNEMQIRATMVDVRPRARDNKGRRITRWLLVSALLIIIISVAAYVIYEMWVSPVLIYEFRLRQVTSLRSEADEAMAAGDYARAREALEQLQTIVPEDPETIAALRRAEQAEKLSGLYGEAKSLIAAGNWDQAIEVLTELQSLDAQYRDLPQLMQMVQESQALDRQYQSAEAAFTRGDWSIAINQYEALHQANVTFKFDEVQSRLFESHLQYGLELVETAGTDPDQVTEALSHFSEALKLRPTDTETLNERRLAETYLAALDSGEPDETVELLQTIYDERPDYAGQEAVHLLYKTLTERAVASLEAGDRAAAITDYQNAAQLSVEDPSEAQQKLAELMSTASP
jgi:Flp pilus assembly protein TadD